MLDQPPCLSEGNQTEVVDSGFYWLISPGIDPSTVLTQEQIDCHFEAAEQINAELESGWEADGKYVVWRMGPVWVDITTGVQDWAMAQRLPDVGCDVGAYNAAYEDNASWRWRGSYAKGLYTYFCLSDTPPPPPPSPTDPPDPGPEDCGTWDLVITRPVQVPINTPTWIYFTFPGFAPDQSEPTDIQTMFDGQPGLVSEGGASGVLEVDVPNKRVKVILTNGEYHHLDIFAFQPDCQQSFSFDTEMLRAITTEPDVCQPSFSSTAIRTCEAGQYHAVITVCDQDFTSNILTVTTGDLLLRLPEIIIHPQTQTVLAGSDLELTVVARYATSYQWQKANAAAWLDLPGETGPTLDLGSADDSDSGTYRVFAINDVGRVVSNPAIVTINVVPPCPYFRMIPTDDGRCIALSVKKVGPGDSDADFVLDWLDNPAPCDDPLVVRCDNADGPPSDWVVFATKVGPGTDPADYVLDWREADPGQGEFFNESPSVTLLGHRKCLYITMAKVGSGSAKEDHTLEWHYL